MVPHKKVKNGKQHRWTRKERDEVKVLRESGMSFHEIGKRIGRTSSSVESQMWRVGRVLKKGADPTKGQDKQTGGAINFAISSIEVTKDKKIVITLC